MRTALTNFDLSVLWFLAAALAGLVVKPFELYGIGVTCDLQCLLLFFYGIVLPLDFLDQMQTYIRADWFTRDSRRFLRRAHHFRFRGDD